MEDHESLVSKVVHQTDKLDALQQAYFYTLQYLRILTFCADLWKHRVEITDAWFAQQADKVLLNWDRGGRT